MSVKNTLSVACLIVLLITNSTLSGICQSEKLPQVDNIEALKNKKFVTSIGDSIIITPLGWRVLKQHKLKETVDRIFKENKNAADGEFILTLIDSVGVDSLEKIVSENKEIKRLFKTSLIGVCLYYYNKLKHEYTKKIKKQKGVKIK